MLAHLAAALLAFAQPVTGAELPEEPFVLPAVTVIERRGFDPQTGAGSSIAVEDSRGRIVDAGDLLGHEAGVTVRQSGGLYQGVSIRGGAPNQAQMFINGVPLPSSLGGSVSPAIFPLESLERIDIYRGALPARYVRSPLTGAVDVVTRNAAASRSSVRLAAGSFGTREIAASIPVGLENTSFLAGGSLATAENNFTFQSDNGTFFNRADDFVTTRRNNDANQASAFAVFESQTGAAHIRGHLLASGANQGISGYSFNQAERVRLDTRLYTAASEAELPHDSGAFSLGLFGGQLRERFRDPRGELQGTRTNVLNSASQGGIRLLETLELGRWEPTAALEAESLLFQAERDTSTLPTYRRQRAAASLGTTGAFERWSWRAATQLEFSGLRADNALEAGKPAGSQTTVHWLSAVNAGAAYQVSPPVRVLVNAGTGFRIPSVHEQFGDRGIQQGNPNLKPERAVFGDIGFQWERKTRKASWLVDVRYFAQRIRDIIGVYQTTPATAKAMNFSSANALGYEASGRLSYENFKATVNAVYATIVNTGDFSPYRGKQLPGRPVWEIGTNVSYRHRYIEPFYALDALGEYFLDPVNTASRKVDSRFLHSAGLTIKPHERIRITGTVENALDVRSYDYVGYPLPGRSFGAVVEIFPF